MRYIKNPENDPYYNMAFDEYCLESLPIDEPVFFLWRNRPAVIVGFNQEVNTEVNLDYLKANNIDLVRRVTGGGAVYHDLGNLNYTIVGRSENLERDYPEYAGILMKALQSLGVPATQKSAIVQIHYNTYFPHFNIKFLFAMLSMQLLHSESMHVNKIITNTYLPLTKNGV